MKKTKRIAKGIRAGVVGALSNIAIASGKLAAGIIGGSTAITADAIQNYSDALSGLATAVGLRYSAKAPDEKHPYGHGRMEYVAAFVVALMILAASVQLFVTSLNKTIKPSPVSYNTLVFIVTLVFASGKILLYIYYKIKNKTAKSPAIKAAALDSLGDIIIGLGAAGSYFFSRFTSFPLDGVCGLAISLIIAYNGISLIRETVADILGGVSDTDIGDKIMQLISENSNIVGTHDLMVHSYGLDKHIASVHIEVPGTLTLAQAHSIADSIERRAGQSLQVDLVVHIDPVHPSDDTVVRLQNKIENTLGLIDKELAYHDFDWDAHANTLKVDIVMPYSMQAREQEVCDALEAAFKDDIKLIYKIDYQ